MRVRIELRVEGQEMLAQGKRLESWHLYVIPEGSYGWDTTPDPKNVVLGEANVSLPRPDSVISTVLQDLEEKERNLRNTLNEDLAELSVRRQNLLAIAMSPSFPAAESPPHLHGIEDGTLILPEGEPWQASLRCFKTGCAMQLGTTHLFWGDLFESVTGIYYFNATSEEGETSFVVPAPDSDTCLVGFHNKSLVTRAGKVFATSRIDFNPAFAKFNAIWNS